LPAVGEYGVVIFYLHSQDSEFSQEKIFAKLEILFIKGGGGLGFWVGRFCMKITEYGIVDD